MSQPPLLDRILDALSRFAAPALPWLFLSLRRASIATLTAAVVAVLFFVVPQSREVLHGLGEPMLKSLKDFNEDSAQLINFWGYLFYVLTAVALGLATWYAARLLSTVEAQSATPSALAGGTGLKTATEWLPRGLGVFVLGAAIGALLYASYTPVLSRPWALALVALAIAGPLLMAIGVLPSSPPAPSTARAPWKVRVLWGGVVLMLLAVSLLFLSTEKWRIWVASIACSTLPAVLLWFLVTRRHLFASWTARQSAHDSRNFSQAIITLFMVVGGSTALVALLGVLPARWVRAFGSAAAVLLFLSSSVLFLAGVHILLRRVASNVPGLTTAVLIVAAVLVARFGDESLGDERLVPEKDAAAPSSAGAKAVSATAPARPFYVNAYGGGLRAATFTALVLARADDASCGRFGEQVAAFSGVSGGSLGIATYLVARQEHVLRGGWSGCGPSLPGATGTPTPLTDIVARTLVQDHLSPAVARMLAVDAPHLPWSPARGQALLDSWQSALVASLAEGSSSGERKPFAFALRLGDLTGGMPQPVAVYFNSTDADSGHIVWFSNRSGGQVSFHGVPVADSGITVGQAVLHSARFPIVSPAGRFPSPDGKGARRLVDGGYVDNSGTTTLLLALRGKEPPHGAATPRLLNLDGNPPELSTCSETDEPGKGDPGNSAAADNPPILTAVRALLQARSAHARAAEDAFKSEVGQSNALDVRLDLEKVFTSGRKDERCDRVRRAHQAPLGWYLSYDAAKSISSSIERGAADICATLGDACRQPPPASKTP